MKKILLTAAAAIALSVGAGYANEFKFSGEHFGGLDHVFFIIMENQTNTDILGNPNAPFINSYVKVANQGHELFRGRPSQRAELRSSEDPTSA